MYLHQLSNGGEILKFVFPQNYNLKLKLFGIIDYSTAIFDVIWCFSIFFIFQLIFHSIKISIIFSIILCLPVLIFSIVGFNGENMGSIIKYMIKYLIKPKFYVFKKNSF